MGRFWRRTRSEFHADSVHCGVGSRAAEINGNALVVSCENPAETVCPRLALDSFLRSTVRYFDVDVWCSLLPVLQCVACSANPDLAGAVTQRDALCTDCCPLPNLETHFNALQGEMCPELQHAQANPDVSDTCLCFTSCSPLRTVGIVLHPN